MGKNKYCYMEIVTKYFTNRGIYKNSKEVIEYPFNNRYIETWRGMFMYDNPTPKSTDKMIGNFYIESDEGDFDINVEIIKTAIQYMKDKYNLNTDFCNFQITNRSIWCEIPYKVFGIYPQEELYKVYKEMAIEINTYICKTLKIKKGLDLGIYCFNRIIHALGSYLPKSKRWVSKIDYNHLVGDSLFHVREDYDTTLEYLLDVKYDNYSGFRDIETIPKCKEWFNKVKYNNNYTEEKVPSLIKGYSLLKDSYTEKINKVIGEIEYLPFEEGNRNNMIYTYTLALKSLYTPTKDIVKKLNNFIKKKEIDYYNLNQREIINSINSAINSNHTFSFKRAEELLNINIEYSDEQYTSLNTFIIPRSFVELLNKNKCHWKCYELLMRILYSEQSLDENFIYNLKGEKYKKNIIAYFEKLQEIGLIFYTQNNDIITTTLIDQPYEVYTNYIIIPNTFMYSKAFKKINKEIKILCELLRSNYIGKYEIHMTNIKLSTICKNLSITMVSVIKAISLFKKLNIVCGKYITFGSKELCTFITDKLLKKIKDKVNSNKKTITTSLLNSFIDNKMIYSVILKNNENIDIPTVSENSTGNVIGTLII